jgi:hypothetical protein
MYASVDIMNQAISKIIVAFAAIFVLILSSNIASAVDYRNAYMVIWDGTACDNLAYAKSMGYDYVLYQSGMEDCMSNIDMYFYIESPDQNLQIRGDFIYFDKEYTAEEKNTYNNLLLWKSTAAFPNNLATGWFFGQGEFFRPLADFQQKAVIDTLVSRALTQITKIEDPSKKFYFGGWSWDVPNLDGDLWSGLQNLPLQNKTGTGTQVTISYWTGTCSGAAHSGITQDYSCYKDGKAAYYKKLFSETRKLYPNMKIYMDPYNPWTSYIESISTRSDAALLKPDILCEEKETTEFVTDSRLFATGLMTKDKMCSDTPKEYTVQGNLDIAGNAAVNGAWFLWYGRIGGTGNFPPLASIKDVPDRLKLIRAMTSWDNVNKVPLSSRKWDAAKHEYTSTLSKANLNIIYSVHPKNKKTYLVVLNKAEGMNLNGKAVDTIYSVDSLFQPKTSATADFTVSNGALYLKSDSNLGKGYIITLKAATTNTTNTTPPKTNTTNTTLTPSCTDSDLGNNITLRGTVSGINASNKTYSFTDTCLTATIIKEYYCQATKYNDNNYNCTNGCENGACKPAAPAITATCTDSDKGNNLAIKGTVTGTDSSGKSYSYSDSCLTPTLVKEYYCQTNKYNENNYNCTNGCENGACKTTSDNPTNPSSDSTDKKSSGGGGGGGGGTIDPDPYCGDNVCTATVEDCTTCSQDCGICPITEYCGDNICTSTNENCTTCSQDCGICEATSQLAAQSSFSKQTETPVASAANAPEQMENKFAPVTKMTEKTHTNELTGLAADSNGRDLINVIDNNKMGSVMIVLFIILIISGAVAYKAYKKKSKISGVFPSHIITFSDLVAHYPEHAQNLKMYIQKAQIHGYAESLIRQSLIDNGWPEKIIEPLVSGKGRGQQA